MPNEYQCTNLIPDRVHPGAGCLGGRFLFGRLHPGYRIRANRSLARRIKPAEPSWRNYERCSNGASIVVVRVTRVVGRSHPVHFRRVVLRSTALLPGWETRESSPFRDYSYYPHDVGYVFDRFFLRAKRFMCAPWPNPDEHRHPYQTKQSAMKANF